MVNTMAKRPEVKSNYKQREAVDPVELQLQIDKDRAQLEEDALTIRVMRIRANILNSYGVEKFLLDIRDSVINSDNFYFTVEGDEDRISLSSNQFLLSVTPETIEEYKNTVSVINDDTYNGYITELLLNTVLQESSDKVFNYVNNDDSELQESLMDLPENERKFMFSSMYLIGVIGSYSDNKVSLRLFI